MPCDPDRWGPGTAGVCMCSTIFFIVSLFLFGFSFDTLDPTVMALKYDANLCFLDTSTVYNSERNNGGRWFTGLGVHFIEFPKTLQTIKFNDEADADMTSVSAKTRDGSSVDMGISFQYRLKREPEHLTRLHLKYGTEVGDLGFDTHGYPAFVVRYARQVTRDVLAGFIVTELWEKRKEVGVALKDALAKELGKRHCELIGFQLLNLDIPADLKEAIVTTTVAFQSIEKAEFEKAQEVVAALTRRRVAEQTATVTVIKAEAEAKSFLLDVQAKAKSLNITTEAEISAYEQVLQTLNLGTDQLLTYIWLDNIIASDPSQLVFSVKQPTQTKDS